MRHMGGLSDAHSGAGVDANLLPASPRGQLDINFSDTSFRYRGGLS